MVAGFKGVTFIPGSLPTQASELDSPANFHFNGPICASLLEFEPCGQMTNVNRLFAIMFQNFLRKKIREIITTGNVDAYTRTHLTGGLPIAQHALGLLIVSLFWIKFFLLLSKLLFTNTHVLHFQQHLKEQPDPFRADYLPPGWPDNQLANHAVLSLIRCLLKHERGNLRNLVSW